MLSCSSRWPSWCARNVEIRRAYRNLLTREHPDKGGNPERFAAIQAAYDVLSNEAKRRMYDETGETEKTVDEEFMDGFAQGTFKDKMRAHQDGQREEQESMEERLTVRQGREADSHTSGFEAWLRSRGHEEGSVYTAEDIVEKYGAAKGPRRPSWSSAPSRCRGSSSGARSWSTSGRRPSTRATCPPWRPARPRAAARLPRRPTSRAPGPWGWSSRSGPA